MTISLVYAFRLARKGKANEESERTPGNLSREVCEGHASRMAETVASLTQKMKGRTRSRIDQLARIEQAPLPPSLEEAFEAVENLDARHPTARGTTYGGIRTAEMRGEGIVYEVKSSLNSAPSNFATSCGFPRTVTAGS
jgi:hypothetical protein